MSRKGDFKISILNYESNDFIIIENASIVNGFV